MTDGIIKGTGNSRYLKSVANFMSLYPTYEDFVSALVAGTLPVDLNGLNANGWQQQGTNLNKASLLTDATAALYGLGATATLNDLFSQRLSRIAYGTYTGAGKINTKDDPLVLSFNFDPSLLIITDGYGVSTFGWNSRMSDHLGIFMKDTPSYVMSSSTDGNQSTLRVQFSGKTVSWYDYNSKANTARMTYNQLSCPYRYVAIG